MLQANKLGYLTISLLCIGLLGGCSVSTHDQGSGDDKKVDIKTPFAEIHVGSDTGAQDAGLSVYPGARAKQEENDKHRANVQIGGENFGVKVVAATYVTDDAPQKVIDFYRNDLKRYGSVLECPKGIQENKHENGGELRCDDKGSEEPGKMDLAVGIPERQHIVSVKPNGKGAEFSTVYIQVRGGKGKGDETM